MKVNQGRLDPIAYTYEADHHCPDCTASRFGVDENGWIPEESTDSEGNAIGAVAPWMEWFDVGLDQCEALSCGTCGERIATAHLDGEHDGHDGCTLTT